MRAQAMVWAACLAACAGGVGEIPDLPGTVALAVQEGGGNAARTVSLGNRGTCALEFDAEAWSSDGGAWISVSPASGLVAPGGSATLTLTFDVATPALPPGTYTGTLGITGVCDATQQRARGSPREVALALTVVPSAGGDVWEALVGAANPAARTGAAGAATFFGTAIFGGAGAGGAPLAGPAVYDPGLGWQLLDGLPGEPAARRNHAGIFAASEFAGLWIWGGRLGDGQLTDTGGFLLGEFEFAWKPVTTASAPSAREQHGAANANIWAVVWGGRDAAGQVLGDGGRYDINNDGWAALAAAGAPAARARHAMVFTGDDVVVWGGEVAGGGATDSGGRYDPSGNSWRGMSASGAPSGRTGMTAIWTDSRVIVWGGRDAGGVRNDGAAYDPVADSWSPIAAGPGAREGHTAVWTGTRMIVWGGLDGAGQPLGDGSSYDAATDQWSPVSNAGAPSARTGHVATWQGDRMIVWGGIGPTDTGKSYR